MRFLSLVLVAGIASGARADTPSIAVENAWARATPGAVKTGAAYFTIVDHGAPDRLIGAATPVAGMADVHETIHDGDVMKMRPVDGVAVGPGAPVVFAPGGYHLMLEQLKQPLTAGQRFPLTLRFQNAGAVEVTVLVRATGATSAGGAGQGMDMPMDATTKP